MSNALPRVDFPAFKSVRYRKVSESYYLVGPADAIRAILKAGGGWVLTRRGPSVVLVDGAVKIDGAIAVRPQEAPTFADTAASKPTSNAVEDMSTTDLEALLKARRAAERTNGASKSRAATTRQGGKSTSKPTDTAVKVSEDTAEVADAATADVSEEELTAAMG